MEVVTAHAVSKLLPSTVVKAEKVTTVGVAPTTVTHVEGVTLGAPWLFSESLLVDRRKSDNSIWKTSSLGSHLAVASPCGSVLNVGGS
jgi:hypothetical protein